MYVELKRKLIFLPCGSQTYLEKYLLFKECKITKEIKEKEK